MKIQLFLALLFISINSFADIQIDGLIIQDSRLSSADSEEVNPSDAPSRVKKGDFEGNGGDVLRLRYAMMYNHLQKLDSSNVVGVLPPSSILNFDIKSAPVKILLTNKRAYIPSVYYSNRTDIKKVVHALFSVQLMNYKKFTAAGGAVEGLSDPLLAIDSSLLIGGVTDFKQRLSQVFFDMTQFFENGSLKKDSRVQNLDLVNFELVDEDIYDRFGTRVCGVYAEKYKVKFNMSCWSRMSALEQRLLAAHEIFRMLNIEDDEYSFTYQFSIFKNYSDFNDYDPYLGH